MASKALSESFKLRSITIDYVCFACYSLAVVLPVEKNDEKKIANVCRQLAFVVESSLVGD